MKLSEKYEELETKCKEEVFEQIKRLEKEIDIENDDKRSKAILYGLQDKLPFYQSNFDRKYFNDFDENNKETKKDEENRRLANMEFIFINSLVKLHFDVFNDYPIGYIEKFCDEILPDKLSNYACENYPNYDFGSLINNFKGDSGMELLLTNILSKLTYDMAISGRYRDNILTFFKDTASPNALVEFKTYIIEKNEDINQASCAVILNYMHRLDLFENVKEEKYFEVFSILVNKQKTRELKKLFNSYGKGSRFDVYIRGRNNAAKRRVLGEKLWEIANKISREN
mgnify:CR=1 FL=1